jgi:hypothetical protein
MPITAEHAGLFWSSSTKAEPMVPEEPITSARNGWGINGMNKGNEWGPSQFIE